MNVAYFIVQGNAKPLNNFVIADLLCNNSVKCRISLNAIIVLCLFVEIYVAYFFFLDNGTLDPRLDPDLKLGERSNLSAAMQTKRNALINVKSSRFFKNRKECKLQQIKRRHPSSNCFRGRQWVLSGSSRNGKQSETISYLCNRSRNDNKHFAANLAKIMAAEL